MRQKASAGRKHPLDGGGVNGASARNMEDPIAKRVIKWGGQGKNGEAYPRER